MGLQCLVQGKMLFVVGLKYSLPVGYHIVVASSLNGVLMQPPVLASMVAHFVKSQGEAGLNRARPLFSKILKWHHWWHHYRTPENLNVVCTIHPWETGRDNCPDWKIGLQNMEIDPYLEAYQRKDIEHADPAERPSHEEYDKYKKKKVQIWNH